MAAAAGGKPRDDIAVATDSFHPMYAPLMTSLIPALNNHYRATLRDILDFADANFEIRDANDGRGKGLYTRVEIAPGRVVAAYMGNLYAKSAENIFPMNKCQYYQTLLPFMAPSELVKQRNMRRIQFLCDGTPYKDVLGSSSAINHSCLEYNCECLSDDNQIWLNDADKQAYDGYSAQLRATNSTVAKIRIRKLMGEIAARSLVQNCSIPVTITIKRIPAGGELLVNYNDQRRNPGVYTYFMPLAQIYSDVQDGAVSDSEDVSECRCNPAGSCPLSLYLLTTQDTKTPLEFVQSALSCIEMIDAVSLHVTQFDVSVPYPRWDKHAMVVDPASGQTRLRSRFALKETFALVPVVAKTWGNQHRFFPENPAFFHWHKIVYNISLFVPVNERHLAFDVVLGDERLKLNPMLLYYFVRRAMKILVKRNLGAIPAPLLARAEQVAGTNIPSAHWQQ
jgi:hypothetical protein